MERSSGSDSVWPSSHWKMGSTSLSMLAWCSLHSCTNMTWQGTAYLDSIIHHPATSRQINDTLTSRLVLSLTSPSQGLGMSTWHSERLYHICNHMSINPKQLTLEALMMPWKAWPLGLPRGQVIVSIHPSKRCDIICSSCVFHKSC